MGIKLVKSTLEFRAGWQIYKNNVFRARIKYFSDDRGIEYYLAKISGRMTNDIDHEHNDPFFLAVRGVIESHLPFIVDLHNVRKMDSAGLASLIMVLRQRRGSRELLRGRTVLTRVPEESYRLFEVYSLQKLGIEIYRDIDEALKKFQQ